MFTIRLCITQQEIFDHLKIRHDVFVIEQCVSMAEEFDFLDRDALLFSGYLDGNMIATARVILKKDYAKLGRFAVLKNFRRKGYGATFLKTIENHLTSQGISEIRLSSQMHAKPFYERMGYVSFGDVYIDANIPHIDMKKKAK